MITKLLQATTLTTVLLLIKRLFIRRKSKLPYRQPKSNWPRRSYREPGQ
jgi:hypothetical protein